MEVWLLLHSKLRRKSQWPMMWSPITVSQGLRPFSHSACCIAFHTDSESSISCIVWTVTEKNWNKLFKHIKHCAGAVAQEGLWTKSQPSLLLICFRLKGFQSFFILIHFRYAQNTCSHCTKVKHRTYPICNAPLLRSVQLCYRNHDEITILMCEQKPCMVWFLCKCKSYMYPL